ncbi:MAG: DNA/RNA non-specific endonuclease [Pseudomonadota bacterium]
MSGYDPDFISDKIRIPMPTFGRSLSRSVYRDDTVLREGVYSDHTNFSVVLNKDTKQPIYAASNIDQSQFWRDTEKRFGDKFGKRNWRRSGDFPKGIVLENEYYKDRKGPSGEEIPNPYDRGHMAMRWNNMWGGSLTAAHEAGKATFIWSNAALQHKNLNQDEWRGLEENIVRDFRDDANDRLSVFTGPIYGDLDRHIHISATDSARAPSGFFKVVCFQSMFDDREDQLGVLAFAIFQDAKVLRDGRGSATVKTDRRYQVTISELQDLTGLRFGRKLFDANPLYYFDNPDRNNERRVFRVPERIPVDRSEDLVPRADTMRHGVEALSEREIVINSAMINPTTTQQAGEWVSLHNRGSGRRTLNNWQLTDRMGRKTVFSGAINSGESLRISGRDLDPVKLPNRGGSLMLRDNNGQLIDHVTWNGNDLKRVKKGMAYMFERGQ